jgi:hypothetical protein
VPPDLATAVDRCLQRDVTKRWPDAKSLREALLPSDEESEDSLPGRMLRISVTIGPLDMLVFGYLSVYSALNPDFRLPPRGIGILVMAFAMVMIVAVVATIRLRSEGLDGRTILMKAFRQPRWWRSWYPRALRRPGDVWSRLPKELTRFRLYRSIFQIYISGIFMPLQFIPFLARRHLPAALYLVAWATCIVAMALLREERLRATKFVRAKVAMTAAEAFALLTTSTWGVSTWRRAPISSFLDGQGRTPRRASEAPDAGDPIASQRPTQL